MTHNVPAAMAGEEEDGMTEVTTITDERIAAQNARLDASLGEIGSGIEALQRRLDLAEQVCLMVGWTAADNTDRGKAKHELWAAWKREYEAQGGSHEPRRHPELSEARIRELAAQRDATVAATLAGIREQYPALRHSGDGE